MSSEPHSILEPEDSAPVIFKDRINPMPAVIDQDHWDLLRLAGTLEEKRKHIFLRVLAETGNLKLACQSAGYRNTAVVNRAAKSDPQFAEALREAAEAAGDFIEAEAVRRAVQGVKKAVYYKGDIIDWEIIYSDSLLQTLLKAAKPDKYADRSKQTTDINVRVGIAVIPAAAKNALDWERDSALVHDRQKALNGPEIVDAEFHEAGDPVKMKRS
jgi:hypothetical protein